MNYIRSSSDSSVKAVRRKTLTAIIMAVMTSLSAFSFHGCSMDENKTAEESSVSTAVTETSAAQSLTVCSTSETRPDNTSALTTLVTSENTSAVTTSPVTSSVKVTTEFDERMAIYVENSPQLDIFWESNNRKESNISKQIELVFFHIA